MNHQGLHSKESLVPESEKKKNRIPKYEKKLNQLSEQLEKEQELRQLATEDVSRLGRLLDMVPQMAMMVAPAGLGLYFNQAWTLFTGQSSQEAKEVGWQAAVHPDDLPLILATLQGGHDTTDISLKIRYRRVSDGVYCWFHTHLKATGSSSAQTWTILCNEMQEPDEPGASMSFSEDRFRFIAEYIPQIVWTALPSGYEDFHNQRFVEFTGMSLKEAEGDGWQQVVHPDDKPRMRKAWENSLKTGEPYEVNYRFRRHDGVYRWFLGRALPMRDQEGRIFKWFGTCTDIHEVIEAKTQAETTNQKLIRINQVLDTFVYMAAHDLKSPVGNLKTLLQLQSKVEEPDKWQEFQRMIEYSVDKLDSTVNGLIEVITVEASQSPARMVQLKEVVEAVLAENSVQFSKSQGRITMDFEGHERIAFNESYLYSIIRNLLTNAIKYRHPNRALELKVTARKEAEYIVITVSDNGIGIDMTAYQDKVFKPFKRFTTQASGTGVGLYIIKNIVEKNGGHIEVESELNAGTTFRVYLREYSG